MKSITATLAHKTLPGSKSFAAKEGASIQGFNSISKSKMILSSSPCRIIDAICGSPSRHF
ncbi:hypothetical protein [Nitrosomonas sp. Nm34]|uniref:hypothetical protein n=1 Tax=Nitrosomonas sp. Nm34 TaxID=1881055 RepID=UPI0008E7D012|nr:hypothetical protein [Nitrosomonas sp. Nm34]SFI50707.1 hypothetical protein SAMN05428978_10142 [Nitrosomonas sp. Nm34]